jgi:heat shock protein HtpX
LASLAFLAVCLAEVIGGSRWALFTLFAIVLLELGAWLWSDRLVIAIHGARPLAYDEAPVVHDAVRKLSARAGISAPRIVGIDDLAPNAFVTGRGPARAVLAVTRGLIDLLDPEEMEGVIAHELSHLTERDVLLSTIAATIAVAVTMLSRLLGYGILGLGYDGRPLGERKDNPLGALLILIVAPIAAVTLQLALSRDRELTADANGARLAGSARGLACALEKLDKANRAIPMRAGDLSTQHLYIVAPKLAVSSWASPFLWTHPPIAKRIRRLLSSASSPTMSLARPTRPRPRRCQRRRDRAPGQRAARLPSNASEP